jgi:hypothetical protein
MKSGQARAFIFVRLLVRNYLLAYEGSCYEISSLKAYLKEDRGMSRIRKEGIPFAVHGIGFTA